MGGRGTSVSVHTAGAGDLGISSTQTHVVNDNGTAFDVHRHYNKDGVLTHVEKQEEHLREGDMSGKLPDFRRQGNRYTVTDKQHLGYAESHLSRLAHEFEINKKKIDGKMARKKGETLAKLKSRNAALRRVYNKQHADINARRKTLGVAERKSTKIESHQRAKAPKGISSTSRTTTGTATRPTIQSQARKEAHPPTPPVKTPAKPRAARKPKAETTPKPPRPQSEATRVKELKAQIATLRTQAKQAQNAYDKSWEAPFAKANSHLTPQQLSAERTRLGMENQRIKGELARTEQKLP